MDQNNSLATSMQQTVEYGNLEFVGDIGELMIDAALNDGILRDVPILGTIVSLSSVVTKMPL